MDIDFLGDGVYSYNERARIDGMRGDAANGFLLAAKGGNKQQRMLILLLLRPILTPPSMLEASIVLDMKELGLGRLGLRQFDCPAAGSVRDIFAQDRKIQASLARADLA